MGSRRRLALCLRRRSLRRAVRGFGIVLHVSTGDPFALLALEDILSFQFVDRVGCPFLATAQRALGELAFWPVVLLGWRGKTGADGIDVFIETGRNEANGLSGVERWRLQGCPGRLWVVCHAGLNTAFDMEQTARAVGFQFHENGMVVMWYARVGMEEDPVRHCERGWTLVSSG